MKKYIYSALALLLGACGTVQQSGTTLTVELDSIDNGLSLVLIDGADYDYTALDTAIIENGKAVFTLTAEEPRAYRVTLADAMGGEVVAINTGEQVTLKGVAHISNQQGRKYFDITSTSISGSPTNDALKAAEPDREKMNEAYDAYHEKHKEVLAKSQQCAPRGSEAWLALEQTPEWLAMEADEHAFFEMVEKTITDAIANNKDNWMSPYFMLTQLSHLTTEANLPQYEDMSEEVKNSYYGKKVAEKVVPMSTDEPMPDFTFTDHASGQEMSLYDICKQNRYVLIDFWASWCNPCRKEIPNFKAQYELYKDKGLQIVSISADTDEGKWLKALEEEQLQWPNDIDGDKGICKLFKVQFYPTVYLLDKDARVIVSNDDARGEALQTKLAELFNE